MIPLRLTSSLVHLAVGTQPAPTGLEDLPPGTPEKISVDLRDGSLIEGVLWAHVPGPGRFAVDYRGERRSAPFVDDGNSDVHWAARQLLRTMGEERHAFIVPHGKSRKSH